MAEKQITELPAAKEVNDQTVIPVYQPGYPTPAQKLTGDLFRKFAGGVWVGTTAPPPGYKVWIDPNGTDLQAGGGGSGEPGGYYMPIVTQPTADTMQVAYSRSDSSLPSVNPVTVNLPKGEKGNDGLRGEQGPAGVDGYTPVKYTDYWTAADKQEMVQDVLAALPVYNREVEDV